MPIVWFMDFYRNGRKSCFWETGKNTKIKQNRDARYVPAESDPCVILGQWLPGDVVILFSSSQWNLYKLDGWIIQGIGNIHQIQVGYI